MWPGLGLAAAAPEQQLQHSLEVAAFELVRLPGACDFACTFPAPACDGPAVAGSSAGDGTGAAGGSGSGSGAFSFQGSAYDLACMALALGWMVGGGADGATPPTPGQWYPTDGRVRFQRCAGGGGGGWGWPGGSRARPAGSLRCGCGRSSKGQRRRQHQRQEKREMQSQSQRSSSSARSSWTPC